MAQKGEQYIVDTKGRKKKVLLGIRQYREMLEDLTDLRILAERRDEPTVSLEEVEARLKARGVL